MARQRYQSYRGRSRKGLIAIIVCVVLVVAAVYGFIWLFEHISMNADGTVTVNLPGFLSSVPPAPTPTPEPVPLEILLVSPSPIPTTEPPSPTPIPSPTPAPPRAVLVSREVMGSPDSMAKMKADAEAAGVNTLVLDYKSNEGDVLTREGWDDACAAFGSDFKYIARISVFLDNTMPRSRNPLAVKHVNGMNWLSSDGRWLNPFHEEAVGYLLTVISDAAALGADGILLDHLCFPWYGKLNQISYGANSETPHVEAIEGFCERLDGLGLLVPVSVIVLQDTVLIGRQEVAGQDLELLKPHFDTVYVEWPDPLETLGEGLTPILAEPPTEALTMRLEGWGRGVLMTGFGTES